MAWPGTPSAQARMIGADVVDRRSVRRSLVRIVMAFDQHREQIAFDALDTATGEVHRGRIRPADRLGLRRWLSRWDGEEIEAALEATTGWRFMVEELRAVGAEVHLAEPAETSALRGPKKRAKTDGQDARRLRELLQAGRVPESWIPPEWVLELRSKVRLRHTLIQQRGEWQQRIQAQLRSEEHTFELQSPDHIVCRLLLEKKKTKAVTLYTTQVLMTKTQLLFITPLINEG